MNGDAKMQIKINEMARITGIRNNLKEVHRKNKYTYFISLMSTQPSTVHPYSFLICYLNHIYLKCCYKPINTV